MSTVDTFKWDTVYSAHYSVVNNAIMSQKTFPPTFDYTKTYDDEGDITSITIKGNWESWLLYPGGSGSTVWMECKVTTGSVSGNYGKGTLEDSSLIIEIALVNEENDDYAFEDDTAKTGTGQAQVLVANILPRGEVPSVTIESYKFPNIKSTSPLYSLLPSVFQNYFLDNISDFKHVFSVMMLNEEADKGDFTWLKPSATSYAVGSTVSGTLEDSVFGILCKVDNNTIEGDDQQAVDTVALQEISNGANSAFVISPEMVTKHMLLAGAVATIQGSTESDFAIGDNKVSISNVNDVVWGNFDAGDGNVYSPKIAKGNFSMSLQDDHILLEIVDAAFSPSLGITMHTTLTQKFAYESIRRESDGMYVFVPDTDTFGSPDIVSNVSVSEGMQIFEIITGAITVLASVLLACSSMISRVVKATEVVIEDSTKAVVRITEEVVATAAEEAGEAAVKETSAITAASVDACVNAGSEAVQTGSATAGNKFKLFCGLTAAISAIPLGGTQIAKAVDEGRYDDIPAFNEFAANCIGAVKWPSMETAELTSIALRRSLVIGVKLDT